MDEHKLADIEKAIANRRYQDPLPKSLETDFTVRTARFRRRLTRSSMWPTIVTYNVFLLVDFFLLRGTFLLSAILHLIVTGFIAIICTRDSWLPDRHDSRWIMAAIPTAMIAQIMTIYSLNSSEYALHYQYLSIMIVVFSNVTLRLGVDYARFVSVSCALMYLVFLINAGTPAHVMIVGYSMMCTAGYLTLIANKRMQLDERFAFLKRLREQALRRDAERQSMHDPLTKLGNRRTLETEAGRIWSDSHAQTRAVAVILFDLDNFKLFNDNQGHARGDDCLRRVGQILSDTVRDRRAIATRYGGEEFLVLAEDTDGLGAYEIAEELRAAVEDAGILHPENGPTGCVTASFGVAAGHTAAVTLEELIEAADEALYAAKRAGRNRTWPQFDSGSPRKCPELAS